MNKIILIGNVTHDLSLKTTQSGVNYCNFNIAVSRRFKDGDGNRTTDFFQITTWRQTAELVAKYLTKGKKCSVVGELQTEKYTDKNGVERTAYKVIADEVGFLSPATKDGGGNNNEPTPPMKPIEDDDLPF